MSTGRGHLSMEAIPTTVVNNRDSQSFSTTGASNVASPLTSPTGDAKGAPNQKPTGARRPVGGIAVLPPMEMKKIHDDQQRKTPTPSATDVNNGKSKSRPLSQTSTTLKSPVSDNSEVCSNCFVHCVRSGSIQAQSLLPEFCFMFFNLFLFVSPLIIECMVLKLIMLLHCACATTRQILCLDSN